MDTQVVEGKNSSPFKSNKRIKVAGGKVDRFGNAMRTGVSDFLDQQKRKAQEFAAKPTSINPFATISSGNGSSDADTAPSPTKKISIERRHTDNYGRSSDIEHDQALELTPCRWNRTGWKYATRDSDYFNHLNKSQNNLGVSHNTLNDTRKRESYLKTQYMKNFKPADNKALENVQKGIPNLANYLSECYPIFSGGKQAAKNYQRGSHNSQYRRNQSLNIHDRGREEDANHPNSKRYHSKDNRFANQVVRTHKNARRVMHRRGHSKDHIYKATSNAQKFLRERNIPIEGGINSNPSQILKLLRLEKEKLRKTLTDIKHNSLKKSKPSPAQMNQTVSTFADYNIPKRQFDGNRTFYSEASSHNPGLSTLGGAMTNYENTVSPEETFVWGGNVISNKHNYNFNRKRTFQSEWQSAANNSGVFMNK
ncbi:unnamed protein product [Moneuplotes crassus]|uniref:Uncharacterized protein n=1 Tax=Euplotes crassus TaxID=5936 RepID=A0AAD1UBZ7_EUPCR|nr:unnamed protein product [Moneuplotes crassus]